MAGKKKGRKPPAPHKPARGAVAPGDLPTREQILEFLRTADAKAGKREIARAFAIKGGDRIALKRLLAEMAEEGQIAGDRKALRARGGLPPVAVLEVKRRDADGDLVAEPTVWDEAEGPRPGVLLLTGHRKAGAHDAEIGIGDRVLARINSLEAPDVEGFRFEAEPIRRLPRDDRRLIGIYRAHPRGGGTIEPIDRRALRSWSVQQLDAGDAGDGDLVRFELLKRGRFATPQVRVVENLGNPDDERKISLIAIHAHGLPDSFPESVIAESEALEPPSVTGRLDLTDVPLLTIDPADARDHDDAVHAEPDTAADNPGGFVVLVAIADVAHFVRPGTRLDREARLRGNSVYFPDRVVPMLPERISNDLCSLREGEDRACLVARMIFDRYGEKRSHTFHRALMRSAAKLSYQEAQAAFDDTPGEKAAPLMEPALKPLWAAYQAVTKARDKRGPLDLDLPERKIKLDAEGRVADIVIPERLDAHRLIEEFMIQANVAAAETLEGKKSPVVYRAHAEPSKEKLKSLREFLETLDLKLPPDGSLKPAAFNRILERAKTLPVPELVNEVVLRSQAQAEYTIDNYGHFGLNLRRYAHFTSPIRRYADLLVHRALIRALGFGEDGLDDSETGGLAATAKLISEAERRAMAAERETIDRLIASHLADRVGATFKGRIAGVTRSGLFVKLDGTGADGFVPISSLESDFYHHVETAHALVGARSNAAYRLGDTVEVRLVEAIPTAGALRFEMVTPPVKGAVAPVKGGLRLKPRRGRPHGPPRRR
ncbi:MAG: ribonuclease R [Hyphomicrobiaceae bacterium]